MGKGGDKATKKATSDDVSAEGNTYNSKLNTLTSDELLKWCKEYNINKKVYEKKDREQMIQALEPYAPGCVDKERPLDNLPLEPLPFTLKTIMDAVPKKCFERCLYTSMSHLATDLIKIAILFYIRSYFDHFPTVLKALAYPVYWYAQGAVMTGVWVLAHECGHQSFSKYEWVNNAVGTVFHSALFVPYHSWRITHGKHHNNTGSCDNDEVFTPATRSDIGDNPLMEAPIVVLFYMVLMLTVGWIPGYLVMGVTGPHKYRGKNVNHFSPTAVFFDESDYWLIVQSDIGFFIAVAALAYSIMTFGFFSVLVTYLIPYFIVNYHLVLITYLQHTDVYMPHFRNKEWTWLRGAMCTVDRSFGPILDHTFHHINDTHVCHHIFSKMPFYHAEEATVAIKQVIGKYYLKDDTPIAHALWRAFTSCQFVEDKEDIVFYKCKK